MLPIRIDDLNTSSLEEFRLGIDELIKWCVGTLPGYRASGYKIVFNLVGGFKALHGYMQTLGMFYADETVYIFETSRELLSIPRMPVDLEASAKQAVRERSATRDTAAYRRRQVQPLRMGRDHLGRHARGGV